MSRGMSSLSNAWVTRSKEKHDLHRIRQESADELAMQRQEALRQQAEHEVAQARIDAERRMLEAELCRANQEALQRQVKNNLKDIVETKVSFDVAQNLEVGELEVDEEALKKLLEDRKNNPVEPQTNEPQTKQPCACCDQPCGCRPGLIRRFCPHCRHRPCEAEKDCGGPEALTKLEQEPMRKPLRPTEIPLKLPVRLVFGMDQPTMEAARIRREPVNGPEPQRGGGCGTNPCQCGRCGVAADGLPYGSTGGIPYPCTKPIAGAQNYPQPDYASQLPPQNHQQPAPSQNAPGQLVPRSSFPITQPPVPIPESY